MGTKMEVMERTMKKMEVRRKEEEEEGEEERGIYRQPAGAYAVPNQEVTPDRSQRGRRDAGMDAIVLRDNVLFDGLGKNGYVAETRGCGLCCTLVFAGL